MTLKHVNAVVVGAGAGGGIVVKELAEAGLSVVLLERGKWNTPFDDRKDDLRNQRVPVLGNPFGPDDERNPRVYVDTKGQERIVWPSEDDYNNNAACVGGGTLSYGAMACAIWRRISACAQPTGPSKEARLMTGRSVTRIWNLITKKQSGRSECQGMIRTTFSALPASARHLRGVSRRSFVVPRKR